MIIRVMNTIQLLTVSTVRYKQLIYNYIIFQNIYITPHYSLNLLKGRNWLIPTYLMNNLVEPFSSKIIMDNYSLDNQREELKNCQNCVI